MSLLVSDVESLSAAVLSLLRGCDVTTRFMKWNASFLNYRLFTVNKGEEFKRSPDWLKLDDVSKASVRGEDL